MYFPVDVDETYPMDTMTFMESLKKWLSAERGRGVWLAACLRVPPSFVAKMASGDKSVPLAHAARIEVFTDGAVTRKAIRPDDWARIWPELAESEQNQPEKPATQAQAAINTEASQQAQGVSHG